MDKETRELIKSKNSSFKKAHKSGKQEDWIEARAQRNRSNRLINMKKRQYIDKETGSKNPKKIWSAIRKLIQKRAKQNKLH